MMCSQRGFGSALFARNKEWTWQRKLWQMLKSAADGLSLWNSFFNTWRLMISRIPGVFLLIGISDQLKTKWGSCSCIKMECSCRVVIHFPTWCTTPVFTAAGLSRLQTAEEDEECCVIYKTHINAPVDKLDLLFVENCLSLPWCFQSVCLRRTKMFGLFYLSFFFCPFFFFFYTTAQISFVLFFSWGFIQSSNLDNKVF